MQAPFATYDRAVVEGQCTQGGQVERDYQAKTNQKQGAAKVCFSPCPRG